MTEPISGHPVEFHGNPCDSSGTPVGKTAKPAGHPVGCPCHECKAVDTMDIHSELTPPEEEMHAATDSPVYMFDIDRFGFWKSEPFENNGDIADFLHI